jgi:hypothetical protein
MPPYKFAGVAEYIVPQSKPGQEALGHRYLKYFPMLFHWKPLMASKNSDLFGLSCDHDTSAGHLHGGPGADFGWPWNMGLVRERPLQQPNTAAVWGIGSFPIPVSVNLVVVM